MRGVGLDDRVNTVNDKADRLLRENQRLRRQMMQDRKLIEKILLKLEPGDVTPDRIQNIEEVAKISASDERRVESLAEQLREQTPARVSVPPAPQRPSDTSDPLAELARLIGSIDPSISGHFHEKAENDYREYDPIAELSRLIGRENPTRRIATPKVDEAGD